MNPSLEFLGSPSKILLNLRPDDEGFIYIDSKDIDQNHTMMHVLAMDEMQSKYKSYSLYESIEGFQGGMDGDMKDNETKRDGADYKDNRQKMEEDGIKNMDKLTLKQENRSIILLNKGDDHVINDFKSAEIETYDTLKDVFALLIALSKEKGNSELEKLLKKWSFITKWDTFNSKEKLKKLRCLQAFGFLFCLIWWYEFM